MKCAYYQIMLMDRIDCDNEAREGCTMCANHAGHEPVAPEPTQDAQPKACIFDGCNSPREIGSSTCIFHRKAQVEALGKVTIQGDTSNVGTTVVNSDWLENLLSAHNEQIDKINTLTNQLNEALNTNNDNYAKVVQLRKLCDSYQKDTAKTHKHVKKLARLYGLLNDDQTFSNKR